MSWTYSGNPQSSEVDRIRFLVGDTDATRPLVQDQEIEWTLSENGNNTYRAASAICLAIAAQLAAQPSLDDTTKIDAIAQSKRYEILAERFRQRARRSGCAPFAGGIDASDKSTRASNATTVQPSFRRNLHDEIGSIGPLTTDDRYGV